MLVAIDFGISNTDLAVLDKDNVSFYSAPSQSTEINDGTIKIYSKSMVLIFLM